MLDIEEGRSKYNVIAYPNKSIFRFKKLNGRNIFSLSNKSKISILNKRPLL